MAQNGTKSAFLARRRFGAAISTNHVFSARVTALIHGQDVTEITSWGDLWRSRHRPRMQFIIKTLPLSDYVWRKAQICHKEA
jgi:hypothetical protein